jgi:hypothetical protein
MAVSTSISGAMERIACQSTAGAYAPSGITNIFTCMSNELSSAKLLYCPSDSGSSRNYATNFGQLADAAPGATKTDGTNCISYFVCGDAVETYPQMILDGDRNIGVGATAGSPPADTITKVSGQQYVASSTTEWAWTANDLHLRVGNAGFADGSVQELSVAGLASALADATNGTPWAGPYYNFPQ